MESLGGDSAWTDRFVAGAALVLARLNISTYFLQDPDTLKLQPKACRYRAHAVPWALHEQLLCPTGSCAAGHASIAYFWILIFLYALSPKYAYLFSEMLEAHAVDTYYGAQTLH